MGNYLADRRKALGLTQKEIAELVDVSEATVSRWESGEIANMRRDRIAAYAKALKTTPSFIMTGDSADKELPAGATLYNAQNVAPLLGTVRAGMPMYAEENIEDYWPVPADRMPNKQTFFLKVKGESMINAGILDGDMVLVEEDSTASNGDMVVALIEDGATVKTFYKEEGVFRLQPENDFMDPIIVKNVTILGKVIAVMRFFS